MSTSVMDARAWALTSLDADVIVGPRAEPDENDSPALPFAHTSEWTLRRFEGRHGHEWVPGRAELRDSALEFRPRVREEDTFATTPLLIELEDIVAVTTQTHFFSKTVHLRTATGRQLRLRCRKALRFAEDVRMAAGAVRAAA